MDPEKRALTSNECHPPSTLINECPVTIHNRRHYASHSVFDLRTCGARWRVVFVHKNPRVDRTLVIDDDQSSSISVDMPPKDYEHFWARIWTQKLPALVIKRDHHESRADINTIDLADRRTKGEHGAKHD